MHRSRAAPRLGSARLPDSLPDEAYARLWTELEHVLRLDEPDPVAAWKERMGVLGASAARVTERRFDAIHLEGPGTDLTVGLFPSGSWWAAEFYTVDGVRHYPNLPTEEIFTNPDPLRAEGHVTSTKPLVLNDGTIIRGLRVRFEGGRAVEIDADEGGPAFREHLRIDDSATRLGELALVDRQGRIGPLGTVFYDTLLDENAASHIALGSAYPFVRRGRSGPGPREREPHACRLHGRLVGARGDGDHARRRTRAGAARRRLAHLTRFGPETEYHRAA